MATISERLAYILTFDVDGGVKSLQKLGNEGDKQLGKVESRLDKVGSGMVKFGAGAMAFAGVAGAGLAKMAFGAADAAANMSALEQVVGETVAHEIGKWAEGSAKGVGLASKDAVAAATSFAQLGKIVGLGGQELSKFSTDLVSLSADFAAFKNVSPEQALQDIQAAFAGSTEVMRKYGIFLDDATLKQAYFRETGEKVTGTLSAQQKIVAINAEMYRQGSDMIGQWGRESGELTGQLATMKAELTNLSDKIGAGVLPHLMRLITVATKVTSAFNSLDTATAGMVGSFAAVGVGMLAVAGAIVFVTGKLILMRAQIAALATQFPRAMMLMKAAAAPVAVALIGLAQHSKAVADRQREMAESIAEFGRAAKGIDQFEVLMKLLVQNVIDGKDAFADLAKEQLGASIQLRDYLADLIASGKATDGQRFAHEQLTKAINEETKARKNAEAATEVETQALESNESALLGVVKAAGEATAKKAALGKQARKSADDIDYVSRAWDRLTGKLKDERTWLDVRQGFNDLEKAALEAYAAAKEGAADAEEKSIAYQQAVIDQKIAVAEYMEQIKLLPSKQQTDILALIDKGEYDLVEYYLGVLSRPRTVSMTPVMRGGGGSTTLIPGSYGAEGGIVNRPTVALIGEAGPEAVVPLHKTPGNGPLPAGGLGGNTFNFTIEAGSDGDPAAIRRAVEAALWQAGAR